jgi:hypothetical protein
MFRLLYSLPLLLSLALVPLASARPLNLNLSLSREGKETYNQFIERANQLAKREIEQGLRSDAGADSVDVVVIGESHGAIAPLLSVKVSRADWQSNPNISRWSNPFPFSKSLLGFESTPPTPPPSPSAPPPSPPAPPPSPTGDILPIDELPTPETEPISLPDQRLRLRPEREQRLEEEQL